MSPCTAEPVTRACHERAPAHRSSDARRVAAAAVERSAVCRDAERAAAVCRPVGVAAVALLFRHARTRRRAGDTVSGGARRRHGRDRAAGDRAVDAAIAVGGGPVPAAAGLSGRRAVLRDGAGRSAHRVRAGRRVLPGPPDRAARRCLDQHGDVVQVRQVEDAGGGDVLHRRRRRPSSSCSAA